jgi:two-component system sensor histidine kinase EvgS
MTGLQGAVDEAVLAKLRESVGNDAAFLAELIDDFLVDAPSQLRLLREAVRSGDGEHAMRAAHTLKGTSRTFGAEELASLCQEAESAARAGDLGAVLAHIDEIGGEWARVGAHLVALRDGTA